MPLPPRIVISPAVADGNVGTKGRGGLTLLHSTSINCDELLIVLMRVAAVKPLNISVRTMITMSNAPAAPAVISTDSAELPGRTAIRRNSARLSVGRSNGPAARGGGPPTG